MPTYEYECDKCGHSFERFQPMTAEPVKRCPECRAKVRRVLGTGAGIIFRGSGFYQTDYRSDGYKSSAKRDVDAGTVKTEKTEKVDKADKPVKAEKTESKKRESKKASSSD